MPEVSPAVHEAETEALTSDELLVEEVSIDGMCGVYSAFFRDLRP